MNLNVLLAREGLSKADLSRQSKLGTSTIWRASTGRPIDPKSARTLCDRFPDLSFEQLTLGDASLRDGDGDDDQTVTDPTDVPAVRT